MFLGDTLDYHQWKMRYRFFTPNQKISGERPLQIKDGTEDKGASKK